MAVIVDSEGMHFGDPEFFDTIDEARQYASSCKLRDGHSVSICRVSEVDYVEKAGV